ncbi:MAG TPA: 50S ribosomal protein L19 [Candidatus Azoamicus sp. MARI]
MNLLINEIEKQQIRNNINFKVGDLICVNFKIIDKENKSKNQNFEGLVIAINKKGLNSTCTIRKISFGEGVEKVFFIHSPVINSIQTKKQNTVKQSKIYYVRHKKTKLLK